MLIRRAVVGALTVMTVMGLPASALAQALPPVAPPRVVDPRPAAGEMVPPGSLTVGARVVGSEPLGTVVVRIDGRDMGTSTPTTRRAFPQAVETTVRAAANLPPGDHVAQVLVDGQVLRAWRFTISDLDVTRLDGSDRVATAVEISRDRYRVDGTADAAVLAQVDQLPDALAGTSLAAHVNAPLLLTNGVSLETAVADELQRILPSGATVFLMGPTTATSEGLAGEIAALGLRAERVDGGDPAGTSVAAAQRLGTLDGSAPRGWSTGPARPPWGVGGGGAGNPQRTVVLAPAGALDEALPLVGTAIASGWPILLTDPDTLDARVVEYLRAAPPDEVLIAGGLSPAVLQETDELVGQANRAGDDDPRVDGSEVVALASAEEVAIALAGAARAAAADAPLLLVADELPDPYLAGLSDEPPRKVVVFGDVLDVSERLVGQLHRAVADRDGPRLRSITPAPASIVRSLDEVVVRFDRRVLPAHSTLSLWIDGHEVTGSLSADGPNGLALLVDQEFPPLTPGRHDLRVVGAATDGEHWVHIDEVMTWLEPRP